MNQVQIDVEQVRLTIGCTDDVLVPYLVTEGFSHRISIARGEYLKLE